MKSDYTNSLNKKVVQKLIYSEVKQQGFKKLIGLAGPNITDYLTMTKKHGIKQAQVYENSYVNLFHQMNSFNPPIKTTVLYQDIYHAPVYQDVLYDLDFTCTIKNANKHIKKFKDVFSIITLSLRGVGLMFTIKKFCKIVSKMKPTISLNVKVTSSYKKHIIQFGNEKSYTLYQYKDSMSMLTIQPNF